MATAIEETQNFNSNSWFWSEAFWLPPNVTWEHFENDESTTIPQVKELLFIFPMAVILYFARILWERFVTVCLNAVAICPAASKQDLKVIRPVLV